MTWGNAIAQTSFSTVHLMLSLQQLRSSWEFWVVCNICKEFNITVAVFCSGSVSNLPQDSYLNGIFPSWKDSQWLMSALECKIDSNCDYITLSYTWDKDNDENRKCICSILLTASFFPNGQLCKCPTGIFHSNFATMNIVSSKDFFSYPKES